MPLAPPFHPLLLDTLGSYFFGISQSVMAGRIPEEVSKTAGTHLAQVFWERGRGFEGGWAAMEVKGTEVHTLCMAIRFFLVGPHGATQQGYGVSDVQRVCTLGTTSQKSTECLWTLP
jgi:hypothetical protein